MASIIRAVRSSSRKARDPSDMMVPAVTAAFSYLALMFISMGYSLTLALLLLSIKTRLQTQCLQNSNRLTAFKHSLDTSDIIFRIFFYFFYFFQYCMKFTAEVKLSITSGHPGAIVDLRTSKGLHMLSLCLCGSASFLIAFG